MLIIKRSVYFTVFVASCLLISGVTKLPTGYLHSWNQVTTLAMARHIQEDPKSWTQPKDVVTRLEWRKSSERPLEDSDFVTFEEFPLYHLLVAFQAQGPEGLEFSARLISILAFFMGGLGLFCLVDESLSLREAFLSLLLYFSSLPLLYYGQAIMSDISMLACLIWAVVFLNRFYSLGRGKDLLAAALLFALSALFKSYSVVFAFLLIFGSCSGFWRYKIRLVQGTGAFVFSIIPVLAWHWYAMQQSGQQEAMSHSFAAKWETLTSAVFLETLLENIFRYLGFVPGALLLIAVLIKILPKIRSKLDLKGTWWMFPWVFLGVLYLLLTVDKLEHHDYYFLLIAPPLIVFTAQLIAESMRLLHRGYGEKVAAGFLIVILASNIGFSAKKVYKAQKENPDVIECSNLIRNKVPVGSFIATLSDVGRYNSLAYYSGRLAINISGKAFAPSAYAQAGADYLIVNLSPDSLNDFKSWLNTESKLKEIHSEKLRDFKGRERFCEIYSLKES